MQMYEIPPLMQSLYLKNKESWELTRLLGYITALGNSTKKLKLTDIMKFPWEETTLSGNTEVSNDNIERLKAKAKNYLNNINQNGE